MQGVSFDFEGTSAPGDLLVVDPDFLTLKKIAWQDQTNLGKISIASSPTNPPSLQCFSHASVTPSSLPWLSPLKSRQKSGRVLGKDDEEGVIDVVSGGWRRGRQTK